MRNAFVARPQSTKQNQTKPHPTLPVKTYSIEENSNLASCESSGPNTFFLGELPAELVQHIATHFRQDSIAALSLCCRALYFTLGTRKRALLRNPSNFRREAERSFLLTLLARDLPDHIFCRECDIIHMVNLIDNSEAKKQLLRCITRATQEVQLVPYNDIALSYPIFQMIMKRHEQGEDVTGYLKTHEYFDEFEHSGHRFEVETKLRVIDGALLRRTKIELHLKTSTFSRDPKLFMESLMKKELCMHLESEGKSLKAEKFHWWLPSNRKNTLWWTRGSHSNPCKRRRPSMPRHCSRCLTEWQISYKKNPFSGKMVLVGVVWENFGRGQDSRDPMFRSHFYAGDPNLLWHSWAKPKNVEEEEQGGWGIQRLVGATAALDCFLWSHIGSTRDAFENGKNRLETVDDGIDLKSMLNNC